MPDPMALVTTALSSFGHANNIIKAILSARDTLVNLEQLNALQSEIASINTGYLALLQQNTALVAEKDDLKKEIARFETWECEAKRYKLIEIQTGVFACALKESESNGEPPHWICADCYNKGKKFILSQSREKYHDRMYKCTGCGFSASIHQSFTPQYV